MTKSKTFIATAPGATIKEQLSNRGMSQKEFAIRMDMTEKHISRLINGEVILTPDVANRLEMVLGIPARFWNNLESIYREKILLAEEENRMDKDIALEINYPYAEMENNGWVEKTSVATEKVRNLRKYFEVTELAILQNNNFCQRVACRKLSHTEKSDIGFLVWLQRVRIESRSKETDAINNKLLKENLAEIRKLTCKAPDDFCETLDSLLSSCGIALMYVPHLKGSGIQGATFSDGNRIVIGMTTRCKDADRFWFSLFHEIGHILLGHLNKAAEITDTEEKEADAFARNALIPSDLYKSFVADNSFSKNSITLFARTVDIAPGIVLGRLQKDGYVKFSAFNELKKQYVIR
ncbi:MAG: ImmA/IrrE family metallo-endopeptidase [Treponemataceae bacterium]|nr:ImmA/IrrE family metallo-endopeptidase [Treponemataceae bacterium]